MLERSDVRWLLFVLGLVMVWTLGLTMKAHHFGLSGFAAEHTFWMESAQRFRYIEMISEGQPLPDPDERMQSPEGYSPWTDTVLQEQLYGRLHRAFAPESSLGAFVRAAWRPVFEHRPPRHPVPLLVPIEGLITFLLHPTHVLRHRQPPAEKPLDLSVPEPPAVPPVPPPPPAATVLPRDPWTSGYNRGQATNVLKEAWAEKLNAPAPKPPPPEVRVAPTLRSGFTSNNPAESADRARGQSGKCAFCRMTG